MPIRWRLTVFNALSIGLILVALGFSLFFLLRDAVLSEVEDHARTRALGAAWLVERNGTLGEDEAERLKLGDEFIIVRDGQGRVLDPEWRGAGAMGAEDPVWARALETGQPASGTGDYSRSPPDFVYAVPTYTPDGSVRVVEVGRSYETATSTLDAFAYTLAGAVLVAFLLSVGGAYLLARAALSPFGAVVRSARRIGEDDLSRRLPVSNPKDEVGGLATTINELLGRLEAAFSRREEALAQREEALARQRRFAANAGHELKTPLTSIAGYARMLEDWGLEDPEKARKGVERISEQSKRMGRLVEDLLTLARGDDGGALLELAPNDLDTVAAEAVEAARTLASGKVAVEYAPGEAPVEATFDKARIRQVADILLGNAAKYTPEGGMVTVDVGQGDGWVWLAVSDTGVGIAADDLPRVFERFYQADPARSEGGAGLGLSIARQIARAHGGEIEAQSKLGKGSTFVLRIPKREPMP